MLNLKGLGAKSQRHFPTEAFKAVTTFAGENLTLTTITASGAKKRKSFSYSKFKRAAISGKKLLML
jgi:hypothetical protein